MFPTLMFSCVGEIGETDTPFVVNGNVVSIPLKAPEISSNRNSKPGLVPSGYVNEFATTLPNEFAVIVSALMLPKLLAVIVVAVNEVTFKLEMLDAKLIVLALMLPFSSTRFHEPTVMPFFTIKFLLDKIHFPLVRCKKSREVFTVSASI